MPLLIFLFSISAEYSDCITSMLSLALSLFCIVCFNLGFGCPMSYSTHTGSFSSPPSPHESSLLAVTGCFEPFNSATQVHGNWRHIASELVSCDRMSDRTRPSQIPVGSIPVATQTTHTELKLIYGQVLAENYNRCSPP